MNAYNDDMFVTRVVYYREPNSTCATCLPPQPGALYSRSFWRLVRYRPHITAKRKILWTIDNIVLNKMFLLTTNFSGNEYENALCTWSEDVKDFSKFRMLFKNKSYLLPLDLIHSGAIIPHYIRVTAYDFHNKFLKYNSMGLCTLPLPPSGGEITVNTNLSDYVKNPHYAWFPTSKAPDSCKLVLEPDWWTRQNRGLRNKPYIENDEELSQHERLRIMRALISKGWITK